MCTECVQNCSIIFFQRQSEFFFKESILIFGHFSAQNENFEMANK